MTTLKKYNHELSTRALKKERQAVPAQYRSVKNYSLNKMLIPVYQEKSTIFLKNKIFQMYDK